MKQQMVSIGAQQLVLARLIDLPGRRSPSGGSPGSRPSRHASTVPSPRVSLPVHRLRKRDDTGVR